MTIENINLSYLEHKGDYFTLSNKNEDDTFMKERLDQAFTNLKRIALNNNV